MITTQEIMLVKEAVSSTALENGWGKEKESEMFDQAINYLLELRLKFNKESE